MNITTAWLDEKEACLQGKGWFAKRFPAGERLELVIYALFADQALSPEKRSEWASWVMRRAGIPEGLNLPETVGGWLYLSGCTLPEGLKLPETVGGGLYLSGCTNVPSIPAGIMKSQIIR